MAKSCEQQINWIREHLVCLATYLSEKSRGRKESQGMNVNDASMLADDILVMFERLVNEMPIEAKK